MSRELVTIDREVPLELKLATDLRAAWLAQLVEAGQLDAAQPITPATLIEAGQAGKRDRIKVLGGGDLGVALTITAHAFSKSARQKIEDAGGSATVVEF